MHPATARSSMRLASRAGMRTHSIQTAVAAALVVAGCAGSRDYFYAPAAHATGQANGFPAAVYPIPPEQPAGEVRIASFGVTEVKPTLASPSTRVLAVRVI